MRIRYCLAIVVALLPPLTHSMSRMPPKLPLLIEKQHLMLDLRPLLAETNNVEITSVFVCRRTGSICHQTIWEIDLPEGWREPSLELLGEYIGSMVTTRLPDALQIGGSYYLDISFNERSRWHKQTVANTSVEFCLEGELGNWKLLDHTACLARRNAEDQQGAMP